MIPSVPGHWLSGNLGKGQIVDSRSYIDLVVRETNEFNKRIILLWVGPLPSVSVTHPDTFRQLARQVSLKARGLMDGYKHIEPWLGEGLLISGGKKWERNRKLLTPAFHFDILNGYIAVMNNAASTLVDKLALNCDTQNIVDVYPYVSRASLDTMLRCSLSYTGNIQHDADCAYIRTVRRLSEISWERALQMHLLSDTVFKLSSLGKEFYHLCDEAHKFTSAIIQERKKTLDMMSSVTDKRRHLDFLDILLTAKDETGQGLSEQEIQDEVDTFTFEGHDTTSSAISWAIYALAKHPDLQHKVYEDVKTVLGDSQVVSSDHLGKFTYLPLFLKEVLRYYSPVPIIGRRHDKPIELDGIEIPVGVTVWIQVYAIHHNEEIWPNNWEFDPERFSVDRRDESDVFKFIPFSAGSRNCIGQVFAMNELKITIARLICSFKISLDDAHEPVLFPDLIMRSENGIKVQLERRHVKE